jgi:hypothetical protein
METGFLPCTDLPIILESASFFSPLRNLSMVSGIFFLELQKTFSNYFINMERKSSCFASSTKHVSFFSQKDRATTRSSSSTLLLRKYFTGGQLFAPQFRP